MTSNNPLTGADPRTHTISGHSTILEALKALNGLSGETMTLFVTDDDGRMRGTLTDGDIRRALIAGAAPGDTVERALHTDFLSVSAADPDSVTMRMAEARQRGIDLMPVIDNGMICGIIDLRKTRTVLPLEAVLMAGGRGERLRPMTLETPKPLLKIGGKAIIDYNVDELENCGVRRIYVTVNYLADKIIGHFAERESRGCIECVREPKRLGTMGSLSLIPAPSTRDILVMNSDLLTNLDFEAMYLHHVRHEADITIAAVPYTVSVPYAIMQTQGDRVTGLSEKPTFNYFANAGVYIMKSGLLKRIPADTYVDAPDFIASLIADGGKAAYFPIEGTWIDIGSPDDFRYADELMSKKIL